MDFYGFQWISMDLSGLLWINGDPIDPIDNRNLQKSIEIQRNP